MKNHNLKKNISLTFRSDMVMLKKYPDLITFLLLIFSVNVGFAAHADANSFAQYQEQEGRRKVSQSAPRPDHAMTTGYHFQQEQTEDNDLDASDGNFYSEENFVEESDSVGDDSVSKYNFIFYLLYKFKYEDEE